MSPSGLSQDERAYNQYSSMCRNWWDVTPAPFERWYLISGKFSNPERRDRVPVVADTEWSGSWDNAVRTLEEAA